ncbi:YncE family protein, partial [Pontibacterium sp.]|uniref:YncE family protein n=1 Tax=Pontibacterium sp. TaxID=2036026 RepID=UPI003512DC16
MLNRTFRRSALAVMVAAVATGAQAESFNRIASFSTVKNLPAGSDIREETSAEIIDVSEDGKTLVYSDSPLEGLGIIDISDADEPEAAGFMKLEGEPTSVAFTNEYVLAGVNTSVSYTQPSGFLAAIDLDDKKIEKRCDLGGQPDSVAVSKDGTYVAVAIENER